MPKFYFHVRDRFHVTRDRVGADLPTFETALHEARQRARYLVEANPSADMDARQIEIANEVGMVIDEFSVTARLN
jgi:hypothetical protein